MNINTIKSKLFSWQAQRRQLQEAKKQKRIEAIAHRIYFNRQLLNQSGSAETDWQAAELCHELYGSQNKWLDRLKVCAELCGLIFIPVLVLMVTLQYQRGFEDRDYRSAQQQIEKEDRRIQQQIEKEDGRLQQQALKDYLDQLSTILLDVNGDELRSPQNKQIRYLMTAITLTAMRDPHFDELRKSQVIRYLSRMGLVQGAVDNPETTEDETLEVIVDLNEVDLQGINLSFLNLQGSNLINADLSRTRLFQINLRGANLTGADLSGAELVRTDLRGADLFRTNFRGTDLGQTILSASDLKDAWLCGTYLPESIDLPRNRDCEELELFYGKPE